jgi:hypothetical protein
MRNGAAGPRLLAGRMFMRAISARHDGSNGGDAAAAAADLYWREIGRDDDDDDNDSSDPLVADIVETNCCRSDSAVRQTPLALPAHHHRLVNARVHQCTNAGLQSRNVKCCMEAARLSVFGTT